jgi:perosamine synthetase
MYQIPFYKPSIGEPEINEVVDCLRSGWLTTGPKTKQFEAEFASYIRQTHAVALNSCTAALHLALEAIGLKAGQTVVVPTMTFAATAEVVRYFNATPLFVDCRPADLNLDVADAAERIEAARARGEDVVAIIPVHYGGQIGDMAGVVALARRYDLKIIEDAAHCCPAYYRDDSSSGTGVPPVRLNTESETHGRDAHATTVASPWKSVGTEAAVSCFSFYANKTITTGEGGMACTESQELADRMRIMSLHGISRDAWKRYTAEGSWYYEIVAPGCKYNLTDLASAIGIHQLRKADWMHEQRAQWAQLYTELLGDVDELILPRELPDRIHSWHLYSVRLQVDRLNLDRAEVISEMKRAGIGTSVHWMPLHMHPYYRETFGCEPSDFPCAAGIYPELVTLPLYPDLTAEDVAYVCRSLKEILAHSGAAFPGVSLPVG